MVEEETFEQFKKSDLYLSLLKIFNNVIYNQKIDVAKPNTAYIYCNVTIPEYDVRSQKRVFDYETKFNVNNHNIFQGALTLYSKNQYIGCYNDINNILYLIDVITGFNNNDFNLQIIQEIIHDIEAIKEEKIRSIKNDIKVKSKSKMMFDSKIYDLNINNTKLSFLDRLLHRTPEGCLRTIDGDVYSIEISNEQNIGVDAYKREIAEKAQKAVAGYRQKYYEDTADFKRVHQKIIESHIHIPHIPPEEVVKNGLMMTIQNGLILYMFEVDIKVHSVVAEKTQRYVKLRNPINFDNGLLTIRTTPTGEIIGVKFEHDRKHFHVRNGDVCLGSAASKIANTRIKSFQDILKLRSSIINMMSICNVSNMYSEAYMVEEVKRLIESAKPGSLKNMVIES